jgi:hypothetical protein
VAEGNGLPRVFKLGAADYRRLTLRDMIAASEVAGADVTELASLRGVARIKALAAMAWVVARIDEPDITYEQVLDGRVEADDAERPLGTATTS